MKLGQVRNYNIYIYIYLHVYDAILPAQLAMLHIRMKRTMSNYIVSTLGMIHLMFLSPSWETAAECRRLRKDSIVFEKYLKKWMLTKVDE